jgi:glucitol/sorbitol PTS system EIIC component
MPGKHHGLAFTKVDSTGVIMPLTTLAAFVPYAADPKVDEPTGFFGAMASAAEWFIGLFQAGGDFFLALVTGILPLLIVLLTAINALIRLIGPERIDKLGAYAARPGLQWYPVRYMVLPALSVFFLTNPMCYTMGRYLPERYKPAFYDSAVSFVHPITGIFPHANAGELFVYLGIAGGITTLGFGVGDLAVRYLLVGLVVILIRGIFTEVITARMTARKVRENEEATA